MIHASAFIAERNDISYSLGPILRTISAPPAGSYPYYYAPVSLPQGATVTRMTLYFMDNDSGIGQTILATLYRAPMPGNFAIGMASLSSPDSPSATNTYVQTTTITFPVVNNQAYAYYIWLKLPFNPTVNMLNVSGVRIDYQYTLALPDIQK